MDSRFPTYYMNDRRIMRMMTPEQFRFFVLATAWSVSNMTDGHIDREDLYLIPFATEDDPQALVKLGLWIVTDNGWMIADFEKVQTSAAKMEANMQNRLEKDRKRSKDYREQKKTETAPERDASRDGHVTLERQGRGRGKAEALDVGTTQTEDEKQAVWDSTPSSNDPRACRSCSQGRLTDALMSQGKTNCNDCISKQRSAA